MTAPTPPVAPEVQAVTLKRADQLCTGDLLWRDETQQWHRVYLLPTQPVAVPMPGGVEICTNLHLEPNPTGPQSIATYTLPVEQVVLAAVQPLASGGGEEVLADLNRAAEFMDYLSGDVSISGETTFNEVSEALDAARRKLRALTTQPLALDAGLRAALQRYEAADHACARTFPAGLRGAAERRTAEEERRRATVALVDAVRSAMTPAQPSGVHDQLEGIIRDAQAASARWKGQPDHLETPHD